MFSSSTATSPSRSHRLPGLRPLAGAGLVGLLTAALALPAGSAEAAGPGTYAFVTSTDGATHGTVSLVDVATHAVTATVDVGATPTDTVVSANGLRAYTANYESGTVSVIDAGQESVVDTIALPNGSGPEGLALSPDGSRLYVADLDQSRVIVIDTASDQVVDTIATGSGVWDVVATGSRIYTGDDAESVTVIDASTDQVISTIPTPDSSTPTRLTLVPGQHLLYAAGNGGMVVNTTDNTVVRSLSFGGQTANDATLSADGARVFVASYNTLYALDSASGDVVGTADASQLGLTPVSHALTSVAVGPDGRLYLGDGGVTDSTLITLDPSTLTPVATATTPDGAVAVTIGTIAAAPAGKADVQASVGGPASVSRNADVIYTETVRNVGPGTAANVVASMLLPSKASLVSATPGYTRVGDLLVWKAVPSMAANGSATYSVKVRYPSSVKPGRQLVTALAGSLRTPDPKLVNNVALLTTTVR